MKILILLTVTVDFFNLIHCSTNICSIKSKCILPNPNVRLPIEIGLIYDLYDDDRSTGKVTDLDNIACKIVSEFGDNLSFKRYPGATVVVAGNSIECPDDSCYKNRVEGCKGIVNSAYKTHCGMPQILRQPVEDCVSKFASDKILKKNGELRCKQGILESKIPALMFNQVYDPCNDFSTPDELKKFLCSTFSAALKDKGC